jgi:hypothetical protein
VGTIGESGGTCDLVTHPEDDQVIYRLDAPGFSVSQDGGETWSLIEGVAGIGPGIQLFNLLVSPSDPDRLYALRQVTEPFEQQLITSYDQGHSWELVGNTGVPHAFLIDPRSSEILYAPGLMVSVDGGASWASSGVDQGALEIGPQFWLAGSDPQIAYANVGGTVFRLENTGIDPD